MSSPDSSRDCAGQAASARRNARRLWRREIFARAAAGESRVAMAAEKGVSVRTLQRALKRAALEHPRENRLIHAALQNERLLRALRLVDQRIARGDMQGVYAMTKLLPLVFDYERFERETLETLAEET